ncbi:MAG TPA: ceramidase domain-containing protein [Kofleriaceae bacterium]|nr:ceramidase domain-containing protein [Kofleriaceae bacterium]
MASPLDRLRVLPRPWRIGVLVLVAVAAAILLLALPAIRQGPRYYVFPDDRTILGIPYFWNVVSNLPFAVVGLAGLAALASRPAPLRPALAAFFAGVFLTAFGSAWYHLAPSAGRLLFDRLPMTIAFAGAFALTLGDRVSPRLAAPGWLAAMIAAATASALAWYATGDLRPYVFVQGTLLLLVPLLLALFPGRHLDGGRVAAALALYLVAKVLERHDDQIYDALHHLMNGHALKHLAAAWACWQIHRAAVAPAAAPSYAGSHEREAPLHHLER